MHADLIVVGGGAAGFFAAITCAEQSDKSVLILEKTERLLHKVKISGGGRCNVTHDCLEPRQLSTNYPRGQKSLIGPFNRFGPADTIEWFTSRGVTLKTEADGRMFPTTNDSQTIVDALMQAARRSGVDIQTSVAVNAIEQRDDLFHLATENTTYTAKHVLLATGGTRLASGAELATSFGHSLLPATPSLFTFKIDDPRLHDLAGLSVDDAEVKIHNSKLKSSGPVLVTHWGLSGPGILKISAWGARELAERGYHFEVSVNWLPGHDPLATFAELRTSDPKRRLTSQSPFPAIPKRLWVRLTEAAGIDEATSWTELGKKQANRLAAQLTNATFAVSGKSTNKAEFVTCGGVARDEINFQTMESKLVDGLFFAGEVVDIDGITGGFNFQNAWTSGFHAGVAVAAR